MVFDDLVVIHADNPSPHSGSHKSPSPTPSQQQSFAHVEVPHLLRLFTITQKNHLVHPFDSQPRSKARRRHTAKCVDLPIVGQNFADEAMRDSTKLTRLFVIRTSRTVRRCQSIGEDKADTQPSPASSIFAHQVTSVLLRGAVIGQLAVEVAESPCAWSSSPYISCPALREFAMRARLPQD